MQRELARLQSAAWPAALYVCNMPHPCLSQTLWLNHAVTTLWPYYNKAVAKMVLEQAKPQIDEAIEPVGLCLYTPGCRTLFISWLPSWKGSSVELFQRELAGAHLPEHRIQTAYAPSHHSTIFNCMCPCSMLLCAGGTAVCRHAPPHMGRLPRTACLACSIQLLRRPLSMLPYLQHSLPDLFPELLWLAALHTAPLAQAVL